MAAHTDSVAYSFGRKGSLIHLALNDSHDWSSGVAVALGLSTAQSNGILVRLYSAHSKDYIQVAVVRLTYDLLCIIINKPLLNIKGPL